MAALIGSTFKMQSCVPFWACSTRCYLVFNAKRPTSKRQRVAHPDVHGLAKRGKHSEAGLGSALG